MTDLNLWVGWRSGDSNPCPPPGTWQDSVFVMLTETPLPTWEPVAALARAWTGRVERCGDRRALVWYQGMAEEYVGVMADVFIRVLSWDAIASRDALLSIAAEEQYAGMTRSRALQAAVEASRDPIYRANTIVDFLGRAAPERAGDLPSFFWEEMSRLYKVEAARREVEGMVLIARALSERPAGVEVAVGLTTFAMGKAEQLPNAGELVVPLEGLIRSLRSANADAARVDTLEARVRRLGGGQG